MRKRLSLRSIRRPSGSVWSTRVAWAVLGTAAVVFVVVVVINLRRHDALVRWRANLEAATGNPAWPAWSPEWPELPAPRQRQITAGLRGVYAYAATHKEVLGHIPCYCGCVREGHRSNLSCYVTEFRADGTPVWTDHSFSCDMCVHITREVMLMSAQRMSLGDIRATIEQRYGHRPHRATNTPSPSHSATSER